MNASAPPAAAPIVAEPQTQYLMIHTSGAVVCDVHEMIDRFEAAGETLQAVLLLTPDGETAPVDVNDISGEMISDGNGGVAVDPDTKDGSEWEIVAFVGSDGEERAVEDIRYTGPDRARFDYHEVHVDKFEPAS